MNGILKYNSQHLGIALLHEKKKEKTTRISLFRPSDLNGHILSLNTIGDISKTLQIVYLKMYVPIMPFINV